MIIVKFQGGLGNQISQYAFTRLLQKIYPNIEVKADLSFYNQNRDHQGYELDRVFEACRLQQASVGDIWKTIRQIEYPYRQSQYGKYIDKLFHRINHFLKAKDYAIMHQIIEPGFPEEQRFFQLDQQKNWYLDGYWYSYNYTLIMDELRKELAFRQLKDEKNMAIIQEIKNCNSISIHIRRGDYVDSQYDILDKDYYVRSIQKISLLVEKPTFFVFSDDINYASQLICNDKMNSKVEFISWNQGADSYYDMYLMSQCKHNIIANSTFSYWAAQLNDNKGKIVIRPKMQTREREAWNVAGWIML